MLGVPRVIHRLPLLRFQAVNSRPGMLDTRNGPSRLGDSMSIFGSAQHAQDKFSLLDLPGADPPVVVTHRGARRARPGWWALAGPSGAAPGVGLRACEPRRVPGLPDDAGLSPFSYLHDDEVLATLGLRTTLVLTGRASGRTAR